METRGKLKVVAAVCALIAGLSVPATAKIVYVDDDAPPGGSGSSWANACNYLQRALTVAGAGTKSAWRKGSTGLTRTCRHDRRMLGPAARRP